MRRVRGGRPGAALGPRREGPNPTTAFPYRKVSTQLADTESHANLQGLDVPRAHDPRVGGQSGQVVFVDAPVGATLLALCLIRLARTQPAETRLSQQGARAAVTARAFRRTPSTACENSAMTPKELVERWVDCFNAGDVDALAALYHEDAVNHQVAETPVHGRAAIREWTYLGSTESRW